MFSSLLYSRHDKHDLFKEPVSDQEAEGYSEIVTKPMDFGTMEKKVESNAYGSGNTAALALYNDFLLVFDNCALYNGEDGEVASEAARLLGLLPETFAISCATAAAKKESDRKNKAAKRAAKAQAAS